jgi:hypothetical protein
VASLSAIVTHDCYASAGVRDHDAIVDPGRNETLLRNTPLIPPSNKYIIGPVPLRDSGVLERHSDACLVRQRAGVRDHDAVVDAEALVRREHLGAALRAHGAHHLLEALVAADTAHY